jgi:FkbM family methyltransferase
MNKFKVKILESLSKKHNNPTLNEKFKDKKIVIYGAGAGFVTFRQFALEKSNLINNIIAVLDLKFKSGDVFSNIPAFSPFDFIPPQDVDNVVAIITSGKQENHEQMKKHLNDLGIKNIIFGMRLFEYNSHYLSDDIDERYYLKNSNDILKSFYLFNDEKSKEVFAGFITSFIERKVNHIPFDSDKDQYFPNDIKMNAGVSRFIDCGAYNGDTLEQIINKFHHISYAACFEPDEENYKKLCKTIENNKNNIMHQCITIPCGVYDKECKLTFSGDILASGTISKDGNTMIQCVSIDNCLPTFAPTMIKMDIECAELKALKGAENTIKKYKPDLAICVYHLPSHIWEIPLYLDSLNLGYKFYLRNYSGGMLETVLYATIQ